MGKPVPERVYDAALRWPADAEPWSPEHIAGWKALRDWWGDRAEWDGPDVAAQEILKAAAEHGIARECVG